MKKRINFANLNDGRGFVIFFYKILNKVKKIAKVDL